MVLDQHGKEIRTSNRRGEISPWLAGHIYESISKFSTKRALPFTPILVDHLGRWIPIAGAPKTIKFRRYSGIGKTRQL